MRFESKRDAWLVLMLRGLPFVVLLIIAAIWYSQGRDMRGPFVGVVLLLIFEIFFFEATMRSTYYVIEGDTLLIRSGIFRWRVPIRSIRSITPTRSALSSPAMSLDRLRIDYEQKAIMVSPEEKRRFIEALRAINPQIVA